MNVVSSYLNEVKIIEPDVFKDSRGFFYESYTLKKLLEYGIDDVFVQDNHSYSQKKGTLRGLHFQKNPRAQVKLVRCTRGALLDVVVDIRKGSPTYLKWVSVELSAENCKQIYVPAGFAHGCLALADDTEIQYKISDYYAKDCERIVRWDDPSIGIDWGVTHPLLSDRDAAAPFIDDCDNNFEWGNCY